MPERTFSVAMGPGTDAPYGESVFFVAEVTDDAGRPVPNHEVRITFQTDDYPDEPLVQDTDVLGQVLVSHRLTRPDRLPLPEHLTVRAEISGSHKLTLSRTGPPEAGNQRIRVDGGRGISGGIGSTLQPVQANFQSGPGSPARVRRPADRSDPPHMEVATDASVGIPGSEDVSTGAAMSVEPPPPRRGAFQRGAFSPPAFQVNDAESTLDDSGDIAVTPERLDVVGGGGAVVGGGGGLVGPGGGVIGGAGDVVITPEPARARAEAFPPEVRTEPAPRSVILVNAEHLEGLRVAVTTAIDHCYALEDGTFPKAAAIEYIIPELEFIRKVAEGDLDATKEVLTYLKDTRSRFERIRETMGQWPELQGAIGSAIFEMGKVLVIAGMSIAP